MVQLLEMSLWKQERNMELSLASDQVCLSSKQYSIWEEEFYSTQIPLEVSKSSIGRFPFLQTLRTFIIIMSNFFLIEPIVTSTFSIFLWKIWSTILYFSWIILRKSLTTLLILLLLFSD